MNTIIILDWDDTLFPTNWVNKNKINLKSMIDYKYIKQFTILDKLLFKLLTKLINIGRVIIITNAMVSWVHLTCNHLPETYDLIVKNIDIISARSYYQNEFPDNIYKWKNMTFKSIINKYLIDNKINNIISIGDADYEYKALIELYYWDYILNNKKYLKSIKFIKAPSYNELLDQLNTVYQNINKIKNDYRHYDLMFSDMF
jgi:hypothetical protein